ncbi:MAG TPA: glutamine--fructose-6-phosphate transaminase (isomerizing) [Deltaproteobacteria bacterium]|nr:glutamine--fructose-6-phosphate transaminase (isomerizing) [Deltaproteobacteria bacterium]HCP48471.1 glutamine--fructose-6-phosphate transaminase (isomerizing) [Deltaproteobacteria bacterium]
MCGIVGYVGAKAPIPILVEGLKRLEYRGYDSSGVATMNGEGKVFVHKRAGRIRDLEHSMPGECPKANVGLAHTRWATHGEPNDANSHPHLSHDEKIAVVHNGIVENHSSLRTMLMGEGVAFRSDTDTEVIPHLIARFYEGDLETAVKRALHLIQGTYGIVAMHSEEPDKLVVARNGSPIVLGVGDSEMFVASDAPALVAHTKQVVYLEDGEIAVLSPEGFRTTDLSDRTIQKDVNELDWEIEEIERGDFEHFMLKEIHEQPLSIDRGLRGRAMSDFGDAKLGGLNLDRRAFFDIKRVCLIACGTSLHAAMAASYLIEELARIPCAVEIASELRYRNPIVDANTLYFAVSQSGETADTLAAMREVRRKGGIVLGVVNVVGSTIARESDGGMYIRSGPEIAVASTKAFTSQLLALTLFALKIGRMRDLSSTAGKQLIHALNELPDQITTVLDQSDSVKEIAHSILDASYVLFLGRGGNYATALEGALKLKEVSYIQCEGFAAAEMKHGPIALIGDGTPVIFLCPRDHLRDKTLSNMEEVKARKGRIIAVCNPGDERVMALADAYIEVPETHNLLTPFLTVIPLQLIAYHAALALGLDVDKPRNLAKSVTVE